MTQSLIILGNNTSAWLAANFFALRRGPGAPASVTVLTGGAPLPTGASFGFTDAAELLDTIGVDENALLTAADGNVCLARRYQDWVETGHEFFHAPADYGVQHIGEFHHLAVRLREARLLQRFDDYSLGAFAARLGRFARPGFTAEPVARSFDYGYQFDRELLVGLLRQQFSRYANVQVIELPFRMETGAAGIEQVKIADGKSILADLYIDTRAATGNGNWAIQTQRLERAGAHPYMELRAADQGFKRIVHCRQTSWCETFGLAASAGPESLDLPPFWQGNTLTLDPHTTLMPCLTLSGEDWLARCLLIFDRLYPAGFNDPVIKTEFNRLTQELTRQWRDFQTAALSLARGDSDFYRSLANLPRSEALTWKMQVFRETGRIAQFERENITAQDWVHLLLGLEYWPRRPDILTGHLSLGELEQVADKVIHLVQNTALRMPSAKNWLNQVVDDHLGNPSQAAFANPEKKH